jgi:6-phosphogluconolactonase
VKWEEIMGSKFVVFVGTLNRDAPYFQGARGKGLVVYSFDEQTLEIEHLADAPEIENPTFLSVDAAGRHVYANWEIFGWKEGLVSAYRFDRKTNALDYINSQPSLGSIAAHNTVSRDGSKLLVANYSMGNGGPDQSVVVYGIRPDGGLTPALASVVQRGTGPDANRQERSHAHSVTELLSGGLTVVADLGTDTLTTYRLAADGSLDQVAVSQTAPGSGPRHVAVHPNGRLVFLMNELDSTVASFRLDPQSGALAQLDSQPAVPAEARASNHCADIQISPDGRFLYGSNRGHDSISTFAVDEPSGMLSLVGYFPCGGATPRNLAITPSGKHVFSANQNADRISIFVRDIETGKLTDVGRGIDVGTPMCVKFAR